ncbi:MAG TPA: hypothetical protein VJ772_08205 [Nitrososphaeraceae archaeon]|nr:hypothetical protein [Nitrososphaeraceae archaeon]
MQHLKFVSGRLLTKGSSKMSLLWTICLTIGFLLVAICFSNQQALSQGSQPPVMEPAQLESIKIDNIVPSQAVNLEEELVVTGQSSDNATKDCSVSVIVNSIQPYQNADASGAGGPTDFSQWKFVLDEQYTQLKEGSNKITAKLLCQTSPARWYSVVVFGVPKSNVTETVSPQPMEQQANLSETVSPQPTEQQANLSAATEQQANLSAATEQQANLSAATEQQANLSETVSPQPMEQQANLSETVSPQPMEQQANLSAATEQQANLSGATEEANKSEEMLPEPAQQELFVTISPLKNPVARGERQNATITVMDSSNRPIADAQIEGNLIYPGDNFEKQFNGITDSQGKFVYSWTIGENGDVGVLDIEVEVSSQGYPPAEAHNSFEITESGESSNTEDPFDSNSED